MSRTGQQRLRGFPRDRRCSLHWLLSLILHGLALGTLLAQTSRAPLTTEPQPKPLSNSRIHKSPPTPSATADAISAFERFYSEFSGALVARLGVGGPSNWEFRVGLSEGTAQGRKTHITVTAIAGNLSVRIANIPARQALKRIRNLVERSAAVSQDKYLTALATGDAAAIEVLWPGYTKR